MPGTPPCQGDLSMAPVRDDEEARAVGEGWLPFRRHWRWQPVVQDDGCASGFVEALSTPARRFSRNGQSGRGDGGAQHRGRCARSGHGRGPRRRSRQAFRLWCKKLSQSTDACDRSALSGIAGHCSDHPIRTRSVLADGAGTGLALFLWPVEPLRRALRVFPYCSAVCCESRRPIGLPAVCLIALRLCQPGCC